MNTSVVNAADAIRYGVAEETARKLFEAHKLQRGDYFTFHMSKLFNDTFGVPAKVYKVNLYD